MRRRMRRGEGEGSDLGIGVERKEEKEGMAGDDRIMRVKQLPTTPNL